MTPEKSLLLCRGAGGIGCWTLNRNFVREFGVDGAFLLADFLRAYVYGDKIKTNKGQWFLWNPHSMMSFSRWTKRRLQNAIHDLMDCDVYETTEIDDELRFKLNFNYLNEIGGSIETKDIIDEKDE